MSEATEDPHTVMHVYEGDGGVIIRENGNVSIFGAQSDEVQAAFNAATATVPADIAALVERLERRSDEMEALSDVAMAARSEALLAEVKAALGKAARDNRTAADALTAAYASRPHPPEWGAQGMTTAQTEARVIARWTRDAVGWVEWPDGEWVRYSDHTTALAAKDAELAEVHQRYVDANEARIDAEAQLAEARKALEQAEQQLDYGQVSAAHQILIRALEAQGG